MRPRQRLALDDRNARFDGEFADALGHEIRALGDDLGARIFDSLVFQRHREVRRDW